jgi:hypothetical protein
LRPADFVKSTIDTGGCLALGREPVFARLWDGYW